jgi:hypothetical protein
VTGLSRRTGPSRRDIAVTSIPPTPPSLLPYARQGCDGRHYPVESCALPTFPTTAAQTERTAADRDAEGAISYNEPSVMLERLVERPASSNPAYHLRRRPAPTGRTRSSTMASASWRSATPRACGSTPATNTCFPVMPVTDRAEQITYDLGSLCTCLTQPAQPLSNHRTKDRPVYAVALGDRCQLTW